MNLKKIGKVFTSKFVGTGPSSYEKRIYRAAVSQRLRNTGLGGFGIVPYVNKSSLNQECANYPKNLGAVSKFWASDGW